MTEQWDVECVMNAMHHATWRGSWATARTIDQVLRPHVCHLLYVIGTTLSNMITPVLSLQGPQYVNFPQQDNIEVNSRPALSSGLNPIAHL